MSKKTRKRTSKEKSPKTHKKEPELPAVNDDILYDILNNSHEGIAIVGDDYKLEYVNEKTCQIFRGHPKDLLGHDFRKFIKQDMAKIVAERYTTRQQGKDVPNEYSIEIIRKDGSVGTAELKITTTVGPDGKSKTIAHVL
ncbi:MAG: PAS domain S-box protein, partial [Candidatus Thorarchaeota archaeon]